MYTLTYTHTPAYAQVCTVCTISLILINCCVLVFFKQLSIRVRVYTVFSFFVFKFANEKRITNSFFVFKFANEKRIRFSFSKMK